LLLLICQGIIQTIDWIPIVLESTRGKILYTGDIFHAWALLEIGAVMTYIFFRDLICLILMKKLKI